MAKHSRHSRRQGDLGLHLLESVLIVVALASLWPLLLGHHSTWYRLWLLAVLGMMVWVAQRRLRRVRAAAAEAKRRRDETRGPAGPPHSDG